MNAQELNGILKVRGRKTAGRSSVSTSVHQEEEPHERPTTRAIPTPRAKPWERGIPRVNFREDSQPITTKEIKHIPKVKVADGEAARAFVEAMARAEARANSKAKERGRKDGDVEHLPILCSWYQGRAR